MGAVEKAAQALAQQPMVALHEEARLHLQGDSIGEVAAVGLMACLLSPVAWIHHYHWLVVGVFALLGADPLRERVRLWAALGVTVFFTMRLPWWGIDWLAHRDWPQLPGRILQNADVAGALATLALLWWVARRPSPDHDWLPPGRGESRLPEGRLSPRPDEVAPGSR